MIRYKIKLKGRVQKVGFRRYAYKHALILGINGYVLNLKDQSIEFDIEGENQAIETYIDIIKKGPKRAFVEDVNVEEQTLKHYKKFIIKKS